VQYPGLQGTGELGHASTPCTPAGFMAASTHRGTYSHVAMVGGAWSGEKGAAAATAEGAAHRGGATPTGEIGTPPHSANARRAGRPTWHTGGRVGSTAARWGASTAPVHGVSNRRRATATEAGAQARSPACHRGRFEPRKLLRAVAARNSGRRGGAGGQPQSGSSNPCERTVLLSHVTLFAFGVIATLPTLTRPEIPGDTTADCHL